MADLPLCLGRRAFALPAGRGQDAWSSSDTCLDDFGNTAPSVLCLPSAAASAEWEMLCLDLLCMKGKLIFWFYFISVFTENAFALWLGRRNEHVFALETSKMNGFLSLLQKLVKSCIRLWKTVLWNLACLQVWIRAAGVNHWFPSDADAALVCWFWQLFLLASIP